MTAVALAPKEVSIPAEFAREILARIERGGLHICEAELRYKLRWDERKHGSLMKLLDELESRGLIESAIHFRLTEQGRAELPADYEPPRRYGTGIPWKVP
jgi:DNA-binding PadR family transcriptional regulator